MQFVLRTKDIGRVRITSRTTQTCVLKSIMVFFEVAYCRNLNGKEKKTRLSFIFSFPQEKELIIIDNQRKKIS